MRTRFKRILLGSALLIGASAALIAWRLRPVQTTVFTDTESIRTAAEGASTRDVLWQPPTPLPEALNPGGESYEPRISADGNTMYLVIGRAGGEADIYESRRSHLGWSAPIRLDAINGEGDDLGPAPSPDDRALYFYSDRPGGLGGYDIWVSRRGEESQWQPPVNLGSAVNSEFNDYGPALAPDGRTLYFASNRPKPSAAPQRDGEPPWQATLREDSVRRDYDLYASVLGAGGFEQAAFLDALNTAANEGAPAVSPSGDFLYFASDRPGGLGGYDLYRCRRMRDGLARLENLGATINSAANELDPGLTMGGYGLYFSSDRPRSTADVSPSGAPHSPTDVSEAGPTERDADQQRLSSSGGYAVFYSASREVFSEVLVQRPEINWAAIWSRIWKNVMWAMLALLLLLLLLALLRDARDRRLALLTKCLLGSLAAHLLLMLLMNFWHVTATLAEAIGRRERIQITLSAPGQRGGLAGQIQATLTEVAAPRAAEVPTPRIETPVDVPAAAPTAQLHAEETRPESADRRLVEMDPRDATNIPVDPARDPAESAVFDSEPLLLAVTFPDDHQPMDVPEVAPAPDATAVSWTPAPRAEPAHATTRPASWEMDQVPPAPPPNDAPADTRRLAQAEPAADASPSEPPAPIATSRAPIDAPDLLADAGLPAPVAVSIRVEEPSSAPVSPAAEPVARADNLPEARQSESAAPAPVALAPARNEHAVPEPSRSTYTVGDVADIALHPVGAPAEASAVAERISPPPELALVMPSEIETRAASTDEREARPVAALQAPPRIRTVPDRAHQDDSGAAEASIQIEPSSRATGSEPQRVLSASTETVAVRDAEGHPTADPAPADAPVALTHVADLDLALPVETASERPSAEPGLARLTTAATPSTPRAAPEPLAAEFVSVPPRAMLDPVAPRRGAPLANPLTTLGTPPSAVPDSSPSPSRDAARRAPAADLPAAGEITLRLPAAEGSNVAEVRPVTPAPSATALSRARSPLSDSGNGANAPRIAALPPTTFAQSDVQDKPLPSQDRARVADAGPAMPLQPQSQRPPTISGPEPLIALRTPTEDLSTMKPPPAAVAAKPLGSIRGRVIDAETGQPLSGALVRLTLHDEGALVAQTGLDGAYALSPATVPDFFALSASHSGFVPESANLAAADLRGKTLTRDFRLNRRSSMIIAIEDDPEVHHLGNDLFEGRINSRFQKVAEGTSWRAPFQVKHDQLPPHVARATLRLWAKGVQCPARIRINGELLETRLENSPEDGSFGRFSADFDPAMLVEGENVIRITAVNCRGDLDDFEFVNVQIRLAR